MQHYNCSFYLRPTKQKSNEEDTSYSRVNGKEKEDLGLVDKSQPQAWGRKKTLQKNKSLSDSTKNGHIYKLKSQEAMKRGGFSLEYKFFFFLSKTCTVIYSHQATLSQALFYRGRWVNSKTFANCLCKIWSFAKRAAWCWRVDIDNLLQVINLTLWCSGPKQCSIWHQEWLDFFFFPFIRWVCPKQERRTTGSVCSLSLQFAFWPF